MGGSEAIYSVGVWIVRPGNESAFIAAWKDFAAWTSMQGGSAYGRLLQDLEDPGRFFSFGPWEDLEGLRAWRQRPEFRKSLGRFLELCDEVAPGTFRLVAEIPAGGTG